MLRTRARAFCCNALLVFAVATSSKGSHRNPHSDSRVDACSAAGLTPDTSRSDVRPKPSPAVEDLVQAQQQRYSLGPLSAAAACVVGIHCCVAEEGYPEKTDAAWKARTWRGHDGTYTLTYRAEMEGRECELVLKCVEMGSEILVHSSTGHSDRASMRCTLSDVVRPSGGADGTSSEPRLIQRGEVLQQMLRAKLLSVFRRQGLCPPRDGARIAVVEQGRAAKAAARVDADMNDLDGMRDQPCFPGLVDQAQTFAVFREGLRVTQSLADVSAKQLKDESTFLFLSVHVLLCCAGLAPESSERMHKRTTETAASSGVDIESARDRERERGAEWELVDDACVGQTDWEIVGGEESDNDDFTCKDSRGRVLGASTLGQDREGPSVRGLPVPLRHMIADLPSDWQRHAGGGSHCVRLVIPVNARARARTHKHIHSARARA